MALEWICAKDYNGGATNSTTLLAAISAIGSNKRTFYLGNGNWSLTENVTFPDNVFVVFDAATFLMGAYTATFNGGFEIKDEFQHFSSETNVFIGPLLSPSVTEIKPEWFGAKGDGTNNDSAATLAASLQYY